MRRSRLLALVTAGVVVFLAISALLTRALSVDGAERSAITDVVQAEARGDAGAVRARLTGCEARCAQRVSATVARLHRAGRVSVIEVETSAGFSLTGTLGTARVVWSAGPSLPIVQCLRVRRNGDVLSGLHVELLALSPRIQTDAACPAQF